MIFPSFALIPGARLAQGQPPVAPGKFFSRLCGGAALLLLLTAASASAQTDPGSGGPVPGNPPDPTAVPLDGGASLLLAGGAAYALRRLRKLRRAA